MRFYLVFHVSYDVDESKLEEVYGTDNLVRALAIDIDNANDNPSAFFDGTLRDVDFLGVEGEVVGG